MDIDGYELISLMFHFDTFNRFVLGSKGNFKTSNVVWEFIFYQYELIMLMFHYNIVSRFILGARGYF